MSTKNKANKNLEVGRHSIAIADGTRMAFSTTAELGSIIQCYGGKTSTIIKDSYSRPFVVMRAADVQYFAGVANFRAWRFIRSIA